MKKVGTFLLIICMVGVLAIPVSAINIYGSTFIDIKNIIYFADNGKDVDPTTGTDTSTTEKKKDDPTTQADTHTDTETSSETTTEEKKEETDKPTSKTIKDVDQRAKYSSGDGKSADKPYLFLLVKNDYESVGIEGSLLNSLIDKGVYAIFKEYDSLDDFDKNPSKPSSEITISPYSKFTETISAKGKYTVSDLNDLLITVSKVQILPQLQTVKTGNSYTFSAKVTGKNIQNLTASWTVSGNKASDTIMAGGTLWVSTSETASKLKITVVVNGIKANLTMNVQKVPVQNAISSLKSAKTKKMVVKWKKNPVATGYQIQYSTNKKFAKATKTKTIKKNSTTKVTLTKLKKKTYYVRIRSYINVYGKKYYSDWSKVKKVKIKK